MIGKFFTASLFVGCFCLASGDCPAEISRNLIQICGPVTLSKQKVYTIDFSSFESVRENSCQCSFTAPSAGDFTMVPTFFTEVHNCGTQITISVNDEPIDGGYNECKAAPLLPIKTKEGDKVEVKVTNTSSTVRKAPYCYIASSLAFNQEITFTCTSGTQTQTKTSTTLSKPTTDIPSTKGSRTTTSETQPQTITSTTLSKPTTDIPTTKVSRTTTTNSIVNLNPGSTSTKTTTSSIGVRTNQGFEYVNSTDACSIIPFIATIAALFVALCVTVPLLIHSHWKRSQEKIQKEKHSTYEELERPKSAEEGYSTISNIVHTAYTSSFK